MNYSGHKLIEGRETEGGRTGLTANRVTEFDRVHNGSLNLGIDITAGYCELADIQILRGHSSPYYPSRNCNQATESKCITIRGVTRVINVSY